MARSTIIVPTRGSSSKPPALPSAEDDPSPSPDAERLPWSPFASLLIVLAMVILGAVSRFGAESAVDTFNYGLWLTVFMLILALIASLKPSNLTREGLFVLWNGLGLSIGVLLVGLLGVSSMLPLPVVLLGVALTAWPRWPEQPLLPLLDRIVFFGGILVLPLLALIQWIVSGIAG